MRFLKRGDEEERVSQLELISQNSGNLLPRNLFEYYTNLITRKARELFYSPFFINSTYVIGRMIT